MLEKVTKPLQSSGKGFFCRLVLSPAHYPMSWQELLLEGQMRQIRASQGDARVSYRLLSQSPQEASGVGEELAGPAPPFWHKDPGSGDK